MTGSRGPVTGKGGRPTKSGPKSRSAKPSRASTPAKRAVVAATLKPSEVGDSIGGDPDTWLAELANISWEKFCQLCGQWRPLSAHDRVQVVKFWRIVDRYEKLAAHVAKLGCDEWFFETEKGHRGRNPEIVELRTLEEAIHENATRFGLDPATRVRLGDDEAPNDDDDPFVAYLRQGMSVDAQAKDEMRQTAARGREVRRPVSERKAAVRPARKAGTPKAQPRPKRTK